jgi:hypothetical protein
MSDLTYEYPAEVVMQRARENRAMHEENERLRAALTWAVEWMERYEGETMPEWKAWAVRGRAALSGAMS